MTPTDVVVQFVECINRGDVDGLSALMTDDYELHVFDEPPQVGKHLGVEGWRGYAAAFPDYVIRPSAMAASDDTVAVLGSTTGSHLGLPDDEELRLTLIWVAEVAGGLVRRWRLLDDNEANRRVFGLPS